MLRTFAHVSGDKLLELAWEKYSIKKNASKRLNQRFLPGASLIICYCFEVFSFTHYWKRGPKTARQLDIRVLIVRK